MITSRFHETSSRKVAFLVLVSKAFSEDDLPRLNQELEQMLEALKQGNFWRLSSTMVVKE